MSHNARSADPTTGACVPVMSVEHVRALVRLLYPDHMTPIAKRQIESACDEAERLHG